VTSPDVIALRRPPATIRCLEGASLDQRLPALTRYVRAKTPAALSRDPAWLRVFRDGMRHRSFALEAVADDQTVGVLPLVSMKSLLFGKRLVSLPYLNTAGVHADDPATEAALVAEAIALADRLGVRALELRHEHRVEHPALGEPATQKIHMRLPLPADAQVLWKDLDAKVRNQVRKGEKAGLTVAWGALDQLDAFYDVFARNMRDLGTPVFGRALFRSILDIFPGDAEFCVVRQGELPVAAALLLHGPGVTEVPSASSLREYNKTCANMLMYWHLLQRAVARGQAIFDFGRSSPESPTFQFKKQWGASPEPAVWQYYMRRGSAADLRPDNPKFRLMIKTWKRLPLWLARRLGPTIARVIP
jgi:FemAB-related protein (PEP-CTERM system-associated)